MGDLISKESMMIGAGLAGLTFVLTLLAGLMGGVPFGLVMMRSLLFSLLLGALGIGAGIMLEKLVPGIWAGEESAQSGEQALESAATDQGMGGFDYTVGDGGVEPSPMQDSAGPSGDGLPEAGTRSTGKGEIRKSKPHVVGDYLIVDDKRFPNNPDDYAKAIRTMMSKDD